jgi:hypothetical protein
MGWRCPKCEAIMADHVRTCTNCGFSPAVRWGMSHASNARNYILTDVIDRVSLKMTRKCGSIKSFERTCIIDSDAAEEVGILTTSNAVCTQIRFPGPFVHFGLTWEITDLKPTKGTGEPGGAAQIRWTWLPSTWRKR